MAQDFSDVREVILMIDTESFGLLPNSIMREIALLAVDADDPSTILKDKEIFLPLEIQETLGRKCYVSTVGWLLMGATQQQIERIRDNMAGDLEELQATCRGFIRFFNEVTANRKYKVWFRRPQHDVPMMVDLFNMLGLQVPWRYDSVCDVATVMDEVGLSPRDVPHDPLYGDKHSSRADVFHQLASLLMARKLNRSRHAMLDSGTPATDKKIPAVDFSAERKLPLPE